jgi:hypothetical protein
VLIQVTAGEGHDKDIGIFGKMLEKLEVPKNTLIDMYYVYLHTRATEIATSGPTWDLVFTNGNQAFKNKPCALSDKIETIFKNMNVFVIRAPYDKRLGGV